MQLVELQRNVHSVWSDEVAVVAISYDPVDVLAGFAAEHGIDFPLLGDVGSSVMDDLGLLNPNMVAEMAHWGRPVEARQEGLP